MKTTIIFFCFLFFICLTFFSCKKNDRKNLVPELSTPYRDIADIDSIGMTFGTTASTTPWGISHSGIDLYPNGNVKKIQSAEIGTVRYVTLKQNASLKWQVDILIDFNNNYSIEYQLVPDASFKTDGETQLANIFVAQNDAINKGDLIANLYTVGAYAHLQFNLNTGSSAICPKSFFSADALSSMETLLQNSHPSWNLCY